MKRRLAPALLLLVPLAACGDDGQGDMTLHVFAAASLAAGFEQIAEEFEAKHDGIEVELSFGGSSDLVTQIQEGAPADVFASADTATMDELVDADLTGALPRDFATNTLVIAVPPGNPAGIGSFQDLEQPDLNLVVCAPEVPCGAAAQQVAANVGTILTPVSEEQSVSDVLSKVTAGEADAGLVYVTDVLAAGDDVEGIEFPESDSVVNSYPIAPVEGSEEANLAQMFNQMVLSDTGQDILADLGFGPP